MARIVKRLGLLVDMTRSCWRESREIAKAVIEVIGEKCRSSSRRAYIEIYFFERDRVMGIGQLYIARWTTSEQVQEYIESFLSNAPRPLGEGSMPVCSMKKFLEEVESSCSIIVSDFKTTVRIRDEEKCAEEIKSMAEKLPQLVLVVLSSRAGKGETREPFEKLLLDPSVSQRATRYNVYGYDPQSSISKVIVETIAEECCREAS